MPGCNVKDLETMPPEPAPDWLPECRGEHLDVRPILDEGCDPLLTVLDLASTIPPDAFMVIEAPFNPMPLRRVLAGQGFSSCGERLAPAHWRISFRRDGRGTGLDAPPTPDTCPGPADIGAPTWRDGGILHIDVRGLQPPQPMVSILRLLAVSPNDGSVIVHHERDPLYLYPELAENGWDCEHVPGDPGEVRLRLTRTKG